MRSFFTSLFIKQSLESFKCDIFQYSKHICATFLSSPTKSDEPFDLIHSDVWELASSFNIFGARWLFVLLIIVLE